MENHIEPFFNHHSVQESPINVIRMEESSAVTGSCSHGLVLFLDMHDLIVCEQRKLAPSFGATSENR